MSANPPADAPRPAPSVFLSYASEDRTAARNLRDALSAYGLDPWYDESGLDGGDAWDQKIRRQIRECDFFMPLISANSEARPEGYFRREWRLAVERTLDMADDHTFLLPVVLDDTTQARARVPDRFLSVQWVRVPDGKNTPALEALCRRLLSGKEVVQPKRTRPDQPAPSPGSAAHSRVYPPFPREEPGQKVRFWFQVAGWGLHSAWILFTGLPRWVQIGVYIWLAIALMSRSCVPSHERAEKASRADTRTPSGLPGNPGNLNGTNVTELGSQIARAVNAEVAGQLANGRPVLAIPFSAPPDDPAAQELAASTFAQVYGKVAVSRHDQVGVMKGPPRAADLSSALALGRAHHSKYVLYGAVDQAQNLRVNIAAVDDGSLLWSHSYAPNDADPSAQIAAEVDSRVPRPED